MKEEKPNPVLFFEVPKPVSAMSAAEKELFMEQIVQALDESISQAEQG